MPKRYWLTAHWPPFADGSEPKPDVYLQARHREAGLDLREGDGVVIYEYRDGPAKITRSAQGAEIRKQRIRSSHGRVVAICEAAGPLESVERAEAVQEFEGRGSMDWAYVAPTRDHATSGSVSRSDLIAALNELDQRDYKPGFIFRSFGRDNSRLLEISQSAFESIRARFGAASRTHAVAAGGMIAASHAAGGEGEVHHALKAYVAAHADAIWRAGARVLRVEYPFPTGDLADVVLREPAGRFAVVEIEPIQGERAYDGTLQALKYRAMLPLLEGAAPAGEVDAILVAHEIAPSIRTLCARFGVKCFVVPMADVQAWVRTASGQATLRATPRVARTPPA